MKEKLPVLVINFLLVLLGMAIAFFIGGCDAESYYRKKAIEADVAEWVVDPSTGDTTFQFKSPEAKQE